MNITNGRGIDVVIDLVGGPYQTKGTHMTSARTLSLSTVTHIINAPLEKVDIADWLFNLPKEL